MNPIPVSIQLKRLTETAIVPTYGTDLAAGFDLHADIPLQTVVAPGDRKLFPTGIALALPAHLALFICPRSGLSNKSGITVHNGPGVIDADYRGGIGVILHNTTDQQFVVRPGDRIAQGVIVPVFRATFEEVSDLPDTDRGDGGFGSTGVSYEIATRPALPGEHGKVVEYARPMTAAEVGCRALSQDMHDRKRLERAEKPLPGGITRWIEGDPEVDPSIHRYVEA